MSGFSAGKNMVPKKGYNYTKWYANYGSIDFSKKSKTNTKCICESCTCKKENRGGI